MVTVVVVAGMFREGEGGLVEEVRASAGVLPGAGLMSRHRLGGSFPTSSSSYLM